MQLTIFLSFVSSSSSHLATIFISEDGHFGLQRKKKIDDPDDIGLLDGLGLFPVEADYRKALEDHGHSSPEV